MRIAEVRSTSLSNGITRQMLTRSNQTSEPRLRGVIKSTPQKIQGAIVNQRPGTIIDEDGLFRKFWLPYNRFTIFKAGDQVSFIPAHDNRGAIATDVTHSTGGLKIIVPGIVKVRNKLPDRVLPIDITKKAMHEISLWKHEAKNEDIPRYFWRFPEYSEIVSGHKCFVIGRKGTGKSAVASYISSADNYRQQTKFVSLQSLPTNELYAEADLGFSRQSQYITLWKFMIYAILLEMQVKRATCEPDVAKQVRKMFPNHDSIEMTANATKNTGRVIKLSAFGIGFEAGLSGTILKNPVPLRDRMSALENFVIRNLDTSTYFLLFDELQEGYDSTIDRSSKYWSLISGLFRAILEVRSILTGAGKNVLPVAFLRDDIFNNILDSDKNKWLDFSTKLDWHTYNLAHLTGFRLWRAIDESYQWSDLPRVWKEFSDIAFAPIGGELDPLKYILRFTSHRPRDVIKFIQLCADRCNKENHFRITKATLLGVENSYSDYFKGEIIDEIHVALPEIHAIFDIFQQIGKPHIRRSEFDAAYTSKLAGDPRFKNPEHVLRILFEYSVIGQITGDKTREIFKYKNPNHSFKDLDSRTCILHRGLFRSVGVV